MRESVIEARLVERVREHGGEIRKVAWIGRRGAPDRMVLLPFTPTGHGTVRYIPQSFWVELKAPGKKPDPCQVREHARLRDFGQRVEVIDSLEAVEALFV